MFGRGGSGDARASDEHGEDAARGADQCVLSLVHVQRIQAGGVSCAAAGGSDMDRGAGGGDVRELWAAVVPLVEDDAQLGVEAEQLFSGADCVAGGE